MSKILLTTVSSVTIQDLGGVVFTHPISNFVLYDSALSENEFELDELKCSSDTQSAVDNGLITLDDGNGNTISDLASYVYSVELPGANVEVSATPPSDTSKFWFNTGDESVYYFDGNDWLSTQIFEATFNDQGTTPNNTFFRIGNTVTNDLGVGFPIDFNAKIIGLSFNRNPNTAQLGNFWLYSNSVTGTDIASVVGVFTVTAVGSGYVTPTNPVDINAGSYASIRWNGLQTNNNIVSLKYRKKYV